MENELFVKTFFKNYQYFRQLEQENSFKRIYSKFSLQPNDLRAHSKN